MQERNRHSLTRALAQLKTYQPPEEVWTYINSQLPEREEDKLVLPQHHAPAESWAAITQELDRHRVQPLWRRPRLLIAACICLLCAVSLMDRDQGPGLQDPPSQAAIAPEPAVMDLLSPALPADVESRLAQQTQVLLNCLGQIPLDQEPTLHRRLATYHTLAARQDSILHLWNRNPSDTTLAIMTTQLDVERRKLHQRLIAQYCADNAP